MRESLFSVMELSAPIAMANIKLWLFWRSWSCYGAFAFGGAWSTERSMGVGISARVCFHSVNKCLLYANLCNTHEQYTRKTLALQKQRSSFERQTVGWAWVPISVRRHWLETHRRDHVMISWGEAFWAKAAQVQRAWDRIGLSIFGEHGGSRRGRSSEQYGNDRDVGRTPGQRGNMSEWDRMAWRVRS